MCVCMVVLWCTNHCTTFPNITSQYFPDMTGKPSNYHSCTFSDFELAERGGILGAQGPLRSYYNKGDPHPDIWAIDGPHDLLTGMGSR